MSKYDFRVSFDLDDESWDSFVFGTPSGCHLQSCPWARLKGHHGLKAVRVTAASGGRIVAGGQMLVRRLSHLGSILYMPKGPLVADDDPRLLESLLDHIHAAARKLRARVISIQPVRQGIPLEPRLIERGYVRSAIELAPTATILIDLSPDREQILKDMKRQTRQNVLRSQREGMRVREGTRADLDTFYQLYTTASRRRGFMPYAQDYFVNLWDTLAPGGHAALIMAEYEGTVVSSLLLLVSGDTVVAKTLGWSGAEASRRPNDAVFWGAMEWAKSRGHRYFDFEGIDRKIAEAVVAGEELSEEFKRTPAFIKLGYGGRVVLSPPPYIYIMNPAARLVFNSLSRRVDVWRLSTLAKRVMRKVLLRKEFTGPGAGDGGV